MTETNAPEWPEEIFMAEREEYDQGVVYAVLSEHATVARWSGDKERDRDFHRYVDGDIHESQSRYFKAMLEAERTRADIADARIKELEGVLADMLRLHIRRGPDYAHKGTREIMDNAQAALGKGE